MTLTRSRLLLACGVLCLAVFVTWALVTPKHPIMYLITGLVFGPSDVLSRIGIGPDCANADLVSEKIRCVEISFITDFILYSLICFGAISIVVIRLRSGRREQVELPSRLD